MQLALTSTRAFFSPLSQTVLRPPNFCAPCHPPRRRLPSPPSPVLRPLLPWLTTLNFRRSMSLLLPALLLVLLLRRLGAVPLSVGVAQLARVRPLVPVAAVLLLLCALLPRPASLLLSLPHAREPPLLNGVPRAVLLPPVATLLLRVVLCRWTSLIRTFRAERCGAGQPPPPPRLTAQAAPSAAPVHLLPLLGVVLSASNVPHPLNVVTVLSAAVEPSPAPSAACVPLPALLTTCNLPPSSPPLAGLTTTTKALLMTASPPPR